MTLAETLIAAVAPAITNPALSRGILAEVEVVAGTEGASAGAELKRRNGILQRRVRLQMVPACMCVCAVKVQTERVQEMICRGAEAG